MFDMKEKKFGSVCAATALSAAILLSGCGTDTGSPNTETAATSTSDTAQNKPQESASGTTATEPAPEIDTSPATFSLFISSNEENATAINFDNPVAKEITEKSGVTLEITQGTSDDIRTMASAGTLPDLIYAGDFTPMLIDAGALVPLDDYIAEDGKNLSALYGELSYRLKYTDGKTYTVGTGGISSLSLGVNGTFQVQNAVLKEAGYPEIKTAEQYESCIKEYLEKYPSLNGRKTVGLSLCGGTKDFWHTTVGRAGLALGYPADGDFIVDDETGSAEFKWLDDGFKDYYKWLNKLYNEGLIPDSSFTQKHTEYSEGLKYGNVLSIADDFESYNEANKYLRENGSGERTFAPLPITMSEDIIQADLADFGYDGEYGIAVTVNCGDAKRALAFLDWWCTDEAQVLVNWGIDGENYTYDENGRRIFTEDELKRQAEDNYAAESGVGLYIRPFPMYGDGIKDANGCYYSANTPYYAESSDSEKETLAAYGIESFSELFPQRDSFPTIRHGRVSEYKLPIDSEGGILEQSLEIYIRAEVTHAITCPEDEFDEKWESITEWIKANGAERLNEIITKMVKDDLKKAEK